jgi:hypothetical protein
MATPFEIVCSILVVLILGSWLFGLFQFLSEKGITPVRMLIVVGLAFLIWG